MITEASTAAACLVCGVATTARATVQRGRGRAVLPICGVCFSWAKKMDLVPASEIIPQRAVSYLQSLKHSATIA